MNRILAITFLLLCGCHGYKAVPQPPPITAGCTDANVFQAMTGVPQPPCEQLHELFDAAEKCYATFIDPAVMSIHMQDVVYWREASEGVDDSGIPTIYTPAGQKVYGYFLPNTDFFPNGPRIFYNFTPVILHELMHFFSWKLHPGQLRDGSSTERPEARYVWETIDHGTSDDPMKHRNCREFYVGAWQ